MGAEPARRSLKQPAAKLEPVIVVLNVLLTIPWIFVIKPSLFVIRNFRGTCLSIEMLNGYMVRDRLTIPGLY